MHVHGNRARLLAGWGCCADTHTHIVREAKSDVTRFGALLFRQRLGRLGGRDQARHFSVAVVFAGCVFSSRF